MIVGPLRRSTFFPSGRACPRWFLGSTVSRAIPSFLSRRSFYFFCGTHNQNSWIQVISAYRIKVSLQSIGIQQKKHSSPLGNNDIVGKIGQFVYPFSRDAIKTRANIRLAPHYWQRPPLTCLHRAATQDSQRFPRWERHSHAVHY